MTAWKNEAEARKQIQDLVASCCYPFWTGDCSGMNDAIDRMGKTILRALEHSGEELL